MTEPLDKSPEQDTKDVFVVHEVQEILLTYSPEAVRVAAKVRESLPHMHVIDGELTEKETTEEQIIRHLGRASH